MAIGWFLLGFGIVVAAGVGFSYPQEKARQRERDQLKSQEAIKAAERAVYDARSEEEYRRALLVLLEISHHSLDDAESTAYAHRMPAKRANG